MRASDTLRTVYWTHTVLGSVDLGVGLGTICLTGEGGTWSGGIVPARASCIRKREFIPQCHPVIPYAESGERPNSTHVFE